MFAATRGECVETPLSFPRTKWRPASIWRLEFQDTDTRTLNVRWGQLHDEAEQMATPNSVLASDAPKRGAKARSFLDTRTICKNADQLSCGPTKTIPVAFNYVPSRPQSNLKDRAWNVSNRFRVASLWVPIARSKLPK
jgi:hypothetical protein